MMINQLWVRSAYKTSASSNLVKMFFREKKNLSSDALLIIKAKKCSEWESNKANLKCQMEE